MIINVKTLNGRRLKVILEREELIYGATAVIINDEIDYKDKVIHPLTNEKLPIIKGSCNRFFIPAHIDEDYEYATKNNLPIKQVMAPYFYGVGEEKVREDVKTQTRHSVIAIIKHNKRDEYLCVDCKNRDCKSFVLGGIEEGEDVIQAAKREVKEETGYLNVSIDKVSNISVYNHFYAGYKGVNRYAVLSIAFGRVLNEIKENISKEESSKHIVKWVKKEELKDFLTVNNNLYALDELFNGSKAYTKEEGKMINSYELDKLDILDAREKVRKSYRWDYDKHM